MKALGKNYKDTEASSDTFERLPVGGYVCRIKAVEDVTAKEYLSVIYDIAEGEHKGFYSDDWSDQHPFAHRFVLSYKETALGMFKGRLKAIDASNGTDFEQQAVNGFNERELIGKLVGLIIGEEEYESDRGEVKTRLAVRSVVSVDRIRSGDFKIPEVKKLKAKAEAPTDGFTSFTGIDESNIPF